MRERKVHHWVGVLIGFIVAVIGQTAIKVKDAPGPAAVVVSATNAPVAETLPIEFAGHWTE